MRFTLHGHGEDRVQDTASGDWYADPFGKAARRWYDQMKGWTDRTQGDGEAPDKTGVARTDDAATDPGHAAGSPDAEVDAEVDAESEAERIC